MAVSGFPIKATAIGKRDASQPWLIDTIDIISITDLGGGQVEITTSTPHGLSITDPFTIFTPQDFGASYNTLTTVSTVESPTVIRAPVIFTSDTTATLGKILSPAYVTWDSDTPEDILREIHIQFDTDSAIPIQVTLDGGLNYMAINNNVDIDGLATFTMFVTKGTLLNFRYGGAGTQKSIAIIVTAS